MNIKHITKTVILSAFLTFAALSAHSQTTDPKIKVRRSSQQSIAERNVRAHMDFLASDAMQGRGSGTQFELLAGKYIASQMRQFGIEPAGDKNASGATGFIQTIKISGNTFAEPPRLTYSSRGTTTTLEHGKEMVVFRTDKGAVSGKLQKIGLGENPKAGAIAFLELKEGEKSQNLAQSIGSLFGSGAAAVILEETPQLRSRWSRSASRPVRFSSFSGSKTAFSPMVLVVSTAAANELAKVANGTNIEIGGELREAEIRKTWNALGMIKGSDPKLASEVILLSAHMDHVGVRESAPGDDKIFNGADDDASGCVAVLELARVLAKGKRPKRTVYFAFYGSEEAGGFGSRYFVKNLPFPKEKLIANLQIEMIGRPDPKVAKDALWLTGYDRSNLGLELSKHGGKIVNDPHPEENFFRRSDNYTLAREGIIAHTVSSFGLHTDYHQPSDENDTIDFGHMTRSINAMVKPVTWLVNSDFRPTWYEGKRP